MKISGNAGRKVVVTGAGGFLGAWLVDALRARGCEVVGVGRSTGFSLLADTLPLDGVDHVFHLAAETGVPRSWEDPVGFHLANSHGTVRVLDQCRRAACSMTYVGAYLYGQPRELPIAENHPLDPNNPYAFSKWMGEQACHWYATVFGVPVTAIRLFNVYGPGQSNQFIVPRIIEQALDPASEVIELMDLMPRRDYLYVADAVAALIACGFPSGYKVYNVGSGSSYSVQEVVDAVQDAVGCVKPVRVVGEGRRNEIPDVRADFRALQSDTGWQPDFSLKQGIAEIVKCMKP